MRAWPTWFRMRGWHFPLMGAVFFLLWFVACSDDKSPVKPA